MLVLVGGSYAFISVRLSGEKKQVLTAGELSLELEEDENNLTIINALPMYDEVGMLQSPFTFGLINNGNVPVHYLLKLADITTGEKLDASIVKYGLTKDESKKIDLLSNLEDNQIDTGIIRESQTIEYSLRLWIDSMVEDNTLIKDKSLSYKIGVEVSQVEGTTKDIVFNVDGDESVFQPKTVVIGDSYGELPIPTKIGYTFSNWNDEEGKVITNKSIVELDTEKLTANWKANEYTITFDANGGSIDTTSKTVIYNGTYGDLPIPTSSNGKFVGWYTEKTGGEKIESTSEVKILNNQTLYAHWSLLLSSSKQGAYVAYVGNNGCRNNGVDTTGSEEAESKNSCLGWNANQTSISYGYCSYNKNFKTVGWRVAYIEDNHVHLIAAGSPECIKGDQVSGLYIDRGNQRAKKYCNSNFVDGDCSTTEDSWSMGDTDFYKMTSLMNGGTGYHISDYYGKPNCIQSAPSNMALCGAYNDLIDNGGWYWLSARYTGALYDGVYWLSDNHYFGHNSTNFNNYYGFRPIIRLSSSVYITGGSGTMNDPYTIANNL